MCLCFWVGASVRRCGDGDLYAGLCVCMCVCACAFGYGVRGVGVGVCGRGCLWGCVCACAQSGTPSCVLLRMFGTPSYVLLRMFYYEAHRTHTHTFSKQIKKKLQSGTTSEKSTRLAVDTENQLKEIRRNAEVPIPPPPLHPSGRHVLWGY